MENSNDINNATIENNTTVEPEVEQEPIKEKKKYIVSDAQKAAQKRYYNKIKENPEFQEVRRGYSKKHYDNNKSTVIARVQRYQARVQDTEQLERLYELQQQGVIHDTQWYSTLMNFSAPFTSQKFQVLK